LKKQREHDHGFEAEAIRRLELGLKAKGEVLERSAYEGSFVICGPADVNQLIRSGCTFFFSDDIFNSDPKMLGLPRNEQQDCSGFARSCCLNSGTCVRGKSANKTVRAGRRCKQFRTRLTTTPNLKPATTNTFETDRKASAD
jgi:hypothetical protein